MLLSAHIRHLWPLICLTLVSCLHRHHSTLNRVHSSLTRLLASAAPAPEHPFTARTKSLLAEMEALGRVRFVVQGSGAILESMGALIEPFAYTGEVLVVGNFTNLRYSDTQRGPLATVSTADPPFECHVFLDEVHGVRFLIVTKFERELRITRFLAADEKTLLSVILAPDSTDAEVQTWYEF